MMRSRGITPATKPSGLLSLAPGSPPVASRFWAADLSLKKPWRNLRDVKSWTFELIVCHMTHLGVLQDVLQLGQLHEVLQQRLTVLGQLHDLVLGLLEGRLEVDDFARVGRPRDVVRQVRRRDLILGQLAADHGDLAGHFLASSDLAGVLALEHVHVGVELQENFKIIQILHF